MPGDVVQIVGSLGLVPSRKRRDVIDDVAVHQPVARPRRHPFHPQRAPRFHQFGDRKLRLVLRVGRLGHPVPARGGPEVEPVQMHGVLREAPVEPAPPNRLADLVMQPFGVRPRPSIDRQLQHVVSRRQPQGIREDIGFGDDEDALRRIRCAPVRIDDDRARELPIGSGSEAEARSGHRPPIQEGSGSVGAEAHLPHRSSGPCSGASGSVPAWSPCTVSSGPAIELPPSTR